MLVMKLISISNPLVKLLIYFIAIAQCCVGRRFAAKGPFLSITLKDDCDKYDSLSSNGGAGRWFDLKSLRPDIRWSIETTGKPLPNWIPNLHSFRTMVGCKYKKETFPDTSIGMDLKFASERTGIDVQIQPSRDLQSKRSNCIIQVSSSLFQRSVGGGKATLMAKLSTRKDSLLQIVKGCYEASLPYRSISAIRVTPAVDFDRGQTSCRFEAVTGTQSTKAVLNLEYDNPTLSVIHSLNSSAHNFFVRCQNQLYVER